MRYFYLNISPERLIEICEYCIKEHQEFKGDKVPIYEEEEFSLLKMRRVKRKVMDYPRWAMRDCGLVTRLNNLKTIAEAVIQDDKIQDRDIRLSETSYSELIKMKNKSNDFEPYVFAAGY